MLVLRRIRRGISGGLDRGLLEWLLDVVVPAGGDIGERLRLVTVTLFVREAVVLLWGRVRRCRTAWRRERNAGVVALLGWWRDVETRAAAGHTGHRLPAFGATLGGQAALTTLVCGLCFLTLLLAVTHIPNDKRGQEEASCRSADKTTDNGAYSNLFGWRWCRRGLQCREIDDGEDGDDLVTFVHDWCRRKVWHG